MRSVDLIRTYKHIIYLLFSCVNNDLATRAIPLILKFILYFHTEYVLYN